MAENWLKNKRYTICRADDPYSRRWNCTHGISENEVDGYVREIQKNDKRALIHKFDNQMDCEQIRKILMRDYQPFISMKNY